MIEEVKLPELGENIDKVVIVAVLVAEGGRVEKEQSIVEVESEKASMEIPAPSAGTVREVCVAVGDEVQVGQVLIRLETSASNSQVEQTVPPSVEPGPETTTVSPAWTPPIRRRPYSDVAAVVISVDSSIGMVSGIR